MLVTSRSNMTFKFSDSLLTIFKVDRPDTSKKSRLILSFPIIE